MGLYEQVKEIAKSKGYSINRLEKELGFARSSISKFNKNVPSMEKVKQIADLLGVSISEITGEETPNTGLSEKDEKDIAKDMDNIIRKLKNNEDGPASYDGEPIPEEDIDLLAGQIELMMRRLKPINKEKYNPYKNKK